MGRFGPAHVSEAGEGQRSPGGWNTAPRTSSVSPSGPGPSSRWFPGGMMPNLATPGLSRLWNVPACSVTEACRRPHGAAGRRRLHPGSRLGHNRVRRDSAGRRRQRHHRSQSGPHLQPLGSTLNPLKAAGDSAVLECNGVPISDTAAGPQTSPSRPTM